MSPKSMHTFDRWRPQKLVERGDQLVSTALDLLAAHGGQWSQLTRAEARESVH